MDISRRQALGWLGIGGGAAGLASCATTSTGAAPVPAANVNISFDHGVASGDATSSAIILWTRVTPSQPVEGPISVQVAISTDRAVVEALSNGKTTEPDQTAMIRNVTTSKSRDYTVKIDMDGLDDDQIYFYRFMVMTASGPVWSPIAKTRTLPETGGEKLAMAVVSCSNWPFGLFNAYKSIAERGDVDMVMHLGDYIYEYGADGYGGEVGEQLGRRHMPVTEIVTLEDYRTRHAQYKTDPDLQAAHAIAPWYCTWDDHESTNNSYRSGAQNHNPEENEGDWTARKQVAVQAYLEWMPVRDPVPGRAKESIYRKVDFGDLATIFMLESRLTGRSDEIDWGSALIGVEPEEIPAAALATYEKVKDPSRTMLGKVQEEWLDQGLKASTASGKTWQVLANQVILAKVVPPDFEGVLTEEQLAGLPGGYAQILQLLAKLGLPFNLDAWDGFPAARERLFASAKAANANLVTLTGDTHTAWANTPLSEDGAQMGVEFGCTSITSPGLGGYLNYEDLGQWMADNNDSVTWFDPFGHGYTMVTLTPEKVVADYYKVTTITEPTFATEWVAGFESTLKNGALKSLEAVV